MKDEARVSLVAIVTKHGHDVAADARRVEGLLRDHCGTCKAEITVLSGAVRERVPAELKSMSGTVPPRVIVVQLSKRLQDNLGVTEELAVWAVESWALSLGLTTLVNAPGAANAEGPRPPDSEAMYREAARRRFCTKCGADLNSSNAPPGLPAHCQECSAFNGEANGQSRASGAAEEMYKSAVGKKYCSRCGAAVVPPPAGQEWRCGDCAHVIRTSSGRVQAPPRPDPDIVFHGPVREADSRVKATAALQASGRRPSDSPTPRDSASGRTPRPPIAAPTDTTPACLRCGRGGVVDEQHASGGGILGVAGIGAYHLWRADHAWLAALVVVGVLLAAGSASSVQRRCPHCRFAWSPESPPSPDSIAPYPDCTTCFAPRTELDARRRHPIILFLGFLVACASTCFVVAVTDTEGLTIGGSLIAFSALVMWHAGQHVYVCRRCRSTTQLPPAQARLT